MEYLTIVVINHDENNQFIEICTELIHSCHCNIETSNLVYLGKVLNLCFLVSGTWSHIAKLENKFNKTCTQHNFQCYLHRTKKKSMSESILPYRLQMIAHDEPGIMLQVIGFLNLHHIIIRRFESESVPLPHAQYPQFTLTASLLVPKGVNLINFREGFLNLCEELNFDGILEPDKY